MKTTEDFAREAGGEYTLGPGDEPTEGGIMFWGDGGLGRQSYPSLERFAALVRAQALATVAEFIAASDEYEGTLGMNGTDDENRALLESVAGRYVRAWAAIRALAGPKAP